MLVIALGVYLAVTRSFNRRRFSQALLVALPMLALQIPASCSVWDYLCPSFSSLDMPIKFSGLFFLLFLFSLGVCAAPGGAQVKSILKVHGWSRGSFEGNPSLSDSLF